MKNLEIDIETFSSVNLAKAGVYRYVESSDFEILLFGYSIDGQDVMRIHPDGGIEKLIDGSEFLGMLEHSQVWLCDVVFMLLTPVCWMTSLCVDRKYAKTKE